MAQKIQMKIDPCKVYKIKGTVQHYAWGGYEYLPALLEMDNPERKPFAEYWMGAHPSAPSQLLNGETAIPLNTLLQEQPELLGSAGKKFGQLPYLLKVLDVKEMLSIQVHPSKEAAEKGFDAEEARNVDIHSPKRNYKDRNHKPEIMIALSDFWLLHGFKPEAELKDVLTSIPQFRSLVSVFDENGYEGLYRYVMELPQKEADAMLLPLVQQEIRRRSFHEFEKKDPGYWVAEYYLNKKAKHIDKGVFSIYFFNLVNIKEGEAIFQAAGVPHAYLQGRNVELMASSDNVLRGGLTNKHIDVAELLKQTRFEPVAPHIVAPEISATAQRFLPPIPDFIASKISLPAGNTHSGSATAPEIFICMEGDVTVKASNTLNIQKGEAFIVFPDAGFTIEAGKDALLFGAAIP